MLWFSMIKDSQGRFPDNAKWGEGWGWALFNAGATDESGSSDFRASCLGCHGPAKSTDWVYIESYPELQAVRQSGAPE